MFWFTIGSLWETSASNLAGNLPAGWLSIAMTVVMIIAFSLSLLYMISRVFSSRRLEMTVRKEMYQLGATIILIMFLAAFESSSALLITQDKDIRDMISEEAAQRLLGKPGFQVNIFDVSYVYFIAMTKCLKSEYEARLNDQSEEILTRMGLSTYVLGANIPLPLSPLFISTWKSLMNSIVESENILWLSIATYFQINFLQWIEASMVAVYLPIGILLRSFPYTRGAGAAIMAVSISLYFVYPFLLNILFFSGPKLPSSCSIIAEVEESPPAQQGKKLCPNDPSAVEEFFKQKSSGSGYGSALPKMDASGFSVVRLYSYFFPFIAMVGTVLFARTVAQILGGNIADIGRGMVRVI